MRPIRGRRTRQKRKGPGRGMHEGREHVGPVPHEALVLQQRPCYSKHTRTCTHAHVNMHMRTHMQRHTHVSTHKQTLQEHTHHTQEGTHVHARVRTHVHGVPVVLQQAVLQPNACNLPAHNVERAEVCVCVTAIHALDTDPMPSSMSLCQAMEARAPCHCVRQWRRRPHVLAHSQPTCHSCTPWRLAALALPHLQLCHSFGHVLGGEQPKGACAPEQR